MTNSYQTIAVQITDIKDEALNVKRFWLKLNEDFDYNPGQIIFVSIPGFGEAAFAPCGPVKLADSPAKLDGQHETGHLELCVRHVGKLTGKLHAMKIGESVGIRGPFGHGWPLSQVAGKNLLIVVGGMGLVPLRTLLLNKNEYLPGAKIQIFYGARTPDDFLFQENFNQWKEQGIDLQLTIDKVCLGWNECVGVVTALFDKHPVVENSAAFLCGPPIMYKFVLQKLQEKQFSEENIYMSLERRMHCGIGICQHCAIGSFYTCKDGPVFKYAEIKNISGVI